MIKCFLLLQGAFSLTRSERAEEKNVWCKCQMEYVNPHEYDHAVGQVKYPCRASGSNGTHCPSSSGLCYRQVRFRRVDVFTESKLSTNWQDYIVHYKDYGCVKNDLLSIRMCDVQKENPLRVKTCCNGTKCNTDESLGLTKNEEKRFNHDRAEKLFNFRIHISIAAAALLVILILIVLVLRKKNIRVHICKQVKHSYCKIWIGTENMESEGESRLFSNPSFGSRLDGDTSELFRSPNTTVSMLPIDMSENSGSGAGPAALVQRTISRQITLLGIKGKGRFGEVYHGKWQGTDVAVKKFHSWDDASWKREYMLYESTMLRHENILGFIGADNKDNGQFTEFWLITDYHERGSLFDWLSHSTASIPEAILMMYTAISGLEHVHKEIHGIKGKCPIAHRDIKSKNILLKTNGECVIADLGLAIRYDPIQRVIDTPDFDPDNVRVGTKRYMAPEILNDSLDTSFFYNYCRADIYSMGLVFWEILRRTRLTEGYACLPYQQPYQEYIPSDPSIEDMKMLVATRCIRPQFDHRIDTVSQVSPIVSLIEECWMELPTARLPALRIKKSLAAHLERK